MGSVGGYDGGLVCAGKVIVGVEMMMRYRSLGDDPRKASSSMESCVIEK